VKSRIVASVPLETLSSVGLNHRSYVFEFDSAAKGAVPELVKVCCGPELYAYYVATQEKKQEKS